ncbi:hypothetical protein M409DRAFT_52078 [Zasmidium cellare ATCC 36951]|uniref:Uncharacterized protein n=1 Tax=Zasmidium cellare ATCC 36951 TaxID=1080233 RepID=A0A6A6CUP1_ZASCE|nr:uncharacterized protein M409DRAFT_52078 [Zasmidium cellare ATCC 36951]KAF2169542.1 hypothetical protein M409DRAFT_52078 [Zasmidium cellare ATCC 36951]
MPPLRNPPAKPMRTERTHEENQERAYIAASRRSDRSLEARVESARRASEIHKKRTGRSLRVREEDVMNEEMYEEEDDDLPMQYRRISALNPNFLNGRLSTYLQGQAGVREYLHNAIYAANQNAQFQQNQFFNPVMDPTSMQSGMMRPQAFSNGIQGMPQSPYPMQNPMQGMRPNNNAHHRAASIATPQELLAYQHQTTNANMKPNTPMHLDTRRMSVPAPAISPGVPSPVASHPRSNSSSHPPTPHPVGQSPLQVPTPRSASGHEHMPQYRASAGVPPVSGYDANVEAQIFPLTTKLPLATQQLMGSNATHPSQLSPGIPTPSVRSYSYNPNGKPKSASGEKTSYFGGLDQTLTPADMYSSQSFSKIEPQSAVSAPAGMDVSFDSLMMGDMGDDTNNFGDLGFDLNSHDFGNSGQITPGSNGDGDWGADMFNYDDAAQELS